MMYKRLTLAAMVLLTPALSHSIDVAKIKGDIINTVNELQDSVIPAVKKAAQAIKDKDYSMIEQYLQDKNKPLIPHQALQFGQNNIGAVQHTLVNALNLIDDKRLISSVDVLNSLQSGLGSQLKSLKTQVARDLQNVNLEQAFATFANAAGNITVADAQNFVAGLKQQYAQANINADNLINSAKRLEGTLSSLKQAAQNLQKQGILDTLNQLSTFIPQFINGDQSVKEDLSDTLIGALNDLNNQLPTARPFITAFTSFSNELIGFVEQLYNTFGPAIWAQVPAAEQNAAKQALQKLQDNKAKIMNAIEMAKDKISKLV